MHAEVSVERVTSRGLLLTEALDAAPLSEAVGVLECLNERSVEVLLLLRVCNGNDRTANTGVQAEIKECMIMYSTSTVRCDQERS